MKLKETENELIGQWIYDGGSARKDATVERIEWLIKNHLKEITNKDGWDTLYIDPDDDRYWELTYLQSELHGGGPPSLINLTEQEAKTKYSF